MIDHQLLEALIAALERKVDEIQKLSDDLSLDVEQVRLNQRAPSSEFSKRFVELQRKHGALVHQLTLAQSTISRLGRA